MPSYKGTLKKLSTDPRAVSIDKTDPPPAEPVAFTPLTDDQWQLLCGTPTGGAVTITAPGTGVTPTSVSRP